MTRKRKNVESTTPGEDLSRAAGFGRDTESTKKYRDDQESSTNEGEQRFPTDLVRYLKQMAKEEPEDEEMGMHFDCDLVFV
jgi:hypothetical protein